MRMSLPVRETEMRERGFLSMRTASLLCLLLLALFMLVQVAHVHPSGMDADHCPVCVVMHSAAPVAMVAAILAFQSPPALTSLKCTEGPRTERVLVHLRGSTLAFSTLVEVHPCRHLAASYSVIFSFSYP